MASAKERLKVFENILARVGADGDVLGEYAKAMSSINSLQTIQDMQPPTPTAQNLPPEQSNTPPMGVETPPTGESTAQAINTPLGT